MNRSITIDDRIRLAQQSLTGLAVGDSFGDQFFARPPFVQRLIEQRWIPAPPWKYTDDTVMAISIFETLRTCGFIDRDHLARQFGARYKLDDGRKYGATAHDILRRIAEGEHWSEVAPSYFSGQGSMGNGGAMRSAPLGGYFCDDFAKVVEQASHSAEVTHSHHEGQAGAVAVAVAAAWVALGGTDPRELFAVVLEHTPDSSTRDGIKKAAALAANSDVQEAVDALGNGSRIISADTVPFTLWCAARHLGNFADAMWTTVAGLGDRDTTCAIVGGIVALGSQVKIPEEWLAATESLENMRIDGPAL